MTATPRTPKTCKRCNGTGFVTFTTYAGSFCMGCGGDGIGGKKPVVKIASASIDAAYGGSDGHVSLSYRAADHRDAEYRVTVYSARLDDADSTTTFTTEAEARRHANDAFRTLKARTAAYYAARAAAHAARRAAR